MVKEVSDKVVIILLVIAVITSVLGTYFIYDFSYSKSKETYKITSGLSTGYVSLNVIDNTKEVENENFK